MKYTKILVVLLIACSIIFSGCIDEKSSSNDNSKVSTASTTPTSPAKKDTTPTYTFDDYFKKGLEMEHAERYAEAAEYYQDALDLDSSDADTWLYYSRCLVESKQYKKGLDACDNTIELSNQLHPLSQAEVWHLKYVALDALGRHSEAEEAYNTWDRITKAHINGN